ncbi:anthranilate phosphoribosyltransferase [Aeromicrobium sp. Leaf350]|uniref:anthranilate phosphoribosyltransferase n=1 Tax=Aeromicrobium sp. Leaf350 TaxID=2876565 RepID=UPI001E2931F7|nr:anthranilate phosphoribosyltransferase [Aeromicrobium sp. Leaf350]
MTFTWPDVLSTLTARRDLEPDAVRWAMGEILDGQASDPQIAGFAVALRTKGETRAELQALADQMLESAVRLTVTDRVLDIVGTGGDLANTVNISSMSAVVAAGSGAGVVKHGNRSASSTSGSADVLEALGVRLDVPADRIVDVYDRAGITFCFARVFHPSFRHIGPARSALGIPTTFNFLGPLTNPASPSAIAIGCADVSMAPLMAGVLAERGCDGLVFRGDDGLDELTTTTTSRVWVVADGEVAEETLDPTDLGFALAPAGALAGGDVAYNADVFVRVLEGEEGAARDAVLLNAGAGIAAHAAEPGTLTERLASGIERARESIDSGAAREVLTKWAAATAELSA